MTKRVKQHQLEDLSRAKYNLAIPNNWVFRDKNKDYGIDAEVEIFDDNDRATGLVYWVQLKATESKVTATARKVDLSIKSIKYYRKLDIPVLIARYSKVHDCFYCKWAHELDLYYAKKNAKTIRVNFSESEKWDKKSAKKIKRHLEKIKTIKEGRFKLPIPLNFIIKDSVVNKVPKGILISSFRAALSEFSGFVILKSDPKDSLISVTIAGDELTISLSSIAGCTFHGVKKNEHENFAEDLVASSLLGFATALSQVGRFETMARIVLDKKIKKRFFQNQKILFRLLPFVFRTSYFGVALDAVIEAIVEEQDNVLEIITSSAVLFESNPDDEEKSNRVEAFLNKCLEKYLEIGEKTQIGICHYNLGNHYRSRGLNKKAICHYLKARKYEDKYLKQVYYYQELGGVLFHYGKYCFSASMYKKALEKGASESVKPLYADALMHSGNYQLAFDVFTDYLKETEGGGVDEWHLKMICLETLIENTGIKEQIRRKKEALEFVDLTKTGKNFVEALEKAIEIDMLCGLAWFNLGVVHSKNGCTEDAVFDFTMCGLAQTWDIEAWVNAILCCFNKKSPTKIFHLILGTGYFFNGDEFLEKLYQEFNNRFDLEMCGRLANMIEEILPKNRNGDDRPAIRLLGNDGIFHNVLE